MNIEKPHVVHNILYISHSTDTRSDCHSDQKFLFYYFHLASYVYIPMLINGALGFMFENSNFPSKYYYFFFSAHFTCINTHTYIYQCANVQRYAIIVCIWSVYLINNYSLIIRAYYVNLLRY